MALSPASKNHHMTWFLLPASSSQTGRSCGRPDAKMQQQQTSDFLRPPQGMLLAVASHLAWLVLQTEKKKKQDNKNTQLCEVFKSWASWEQQDSSTMLHSTAQSHSQHPVLLTAPLQRCSLLICLGQEHKPEQRHCPKEFCLVFASRQQIYRNCLERSFYTHREFNIHHEHKFSVDLVKLHQLP